MYGFSAVEKVGALRQRFVRGVCVAEGDEGEVPTVLGRKLQTAASLMVVLLVLVRRVSSCEVIWSSRICTQRMVNSTP